jgi:SAM-dependent methyltransferase
MVEPEIEKAARFGEPSYVWRAGQERRLAMIVRAAGDRVGGTVLENGCGVGLYLQRLQQMGGRTVGLEFDLERAKLAAARAAPVANAAGEMLPFEAAAFDLVLSHEVLEHVADDRAAVAEMVRVLRPGGRLVLFCPNRGYPFETHGIFWHGRYYFGNKPLVNYLPRRWRDRLAPHVRVYGRQTLEGIFMDLPVKFVRRTIIFGAYDNLIGRFGAFGRLLRATLQTLETSPLRALGLSHFWVVEKTG